MCSWLAKDKVVSDSLQIKEPEFWHDPQLNFVDIPWEHFNLSLESKQLGTASQDVGGANSANKNVCPGEKALQLAFSLGKR